MNGYMIVNLLPILRDSIVDRQQFNLTSKSVRHMLLLKWSTIEAIKSQESCEVIFLCEKETSTLNLMMKSLIPTGKSGLSFDLISRNLQDSPIYRTLQSSGISGPLKQLPQDPFHSPFDLEESRGIQTPISRNLQTSQTTTPEPILLYIWPT